MPASFHAAAEEERSAAPFDPALATADVRTVPIVALVDLLPETHAPERVAEYLQAMEAGARFPPIAVVRIAGKLYVADGHKRLSACRRLGLPEIPVEIWTPVRWLRDQARQLAGNVRKNARILTLLFRDPGEARRLAGTTWRHWARVASCLALRAGVRRQRT